MKKSILLIGSLIAALASQPAWSTTYTVRGRVIYTEGHEQPNCRLLQIKRDDNGQLMLLRIGTNGGDNMLAVTLTAIQVGLQVNVAYDPALTSGCGTEPRLLYIDIIAPGY